LRKSISPLSTSSLKIQSALLAFKAYFPLECKDAINNLVLNSLPELITSSQDRLNTFELCEIIEDYSRLRLLVETMSKKDQAITVEKLSNKLKYVFGTIGEIYSSKLKDDFFRFFNRPFICEIISERTNNEGFCKLISSFHSCEHSEA